MTRKRWLGVVGLVVVLFLDGLYWYRTHGWGEALWFPSLLLVQTALIWLWQRRKRSREGRPGVRPGGE